MIRSPRLTAALAALAHVLALGCGGAQTPPTSPESPVAVNGPEPAPIAEVALRPTATQPSDPAPAAAAPAPPARPPQPPTPIADAHRAGAEKLLGARHERFAWAKLAYLCDRIGHRLAGSPSYERAAVWAEEAMKKDGLDARREKVMTQVWTRGAAQASVVAPVTTPLAVLALGNSAGTPAKGVTAEVVIVDSTEALDALGAAGVKGKIVLFNHKMPRYTDEHGTGYAGASRVRMRGPSAAAKLGAAAVLVRSATAVSLRTPHTGATVFEDGVKPIPAAAVAIEDAELLVRLAADGPVKVKLVLGCKTGKTVAQSNVIGELRGRERPGEIVVIGAHLDSWDVGQGAHDDGVGVVIMMEAAALLKRLGLTPRRTIRVVLFANEERGLDGGLAYAKDHADELPDHVAALESDGGAFRPVGITYDGKPEDPAFLRLSDIVTLLAPLGAARAEIGFAGVDTLPMKAANVPRLGHEADGSTYFDIHHTEADTLDKVDPQQLQDNVIVVAIVAWVLAEMPDRLSDALPAR